MSAKYVYVMKELNKTWPGGKQVIKDGWLSFYPGAKIGVLGSNGAGKSTLLKIMAGLDKEFSGEAWSAENIKVGYLAQEPILDKDLNVFDNIMLGISDVKDTLKEFEEVSLKFGDVSTDEEMNDLLAKQAELQEKIDAIDGWDIDRHIEIAMDALRCPPADSTISDLSGGEKRRVALCQLLLSKPDMLLLDEPTNHLDAESVAWLERTLADFSGTVVAITHDRYFLDNVAGWILEIDRGNLIPFEGNYSNWLEHKHKRLKQEAREEVSIQKTISNELDWVRQNPKARQSKSQARVNAYEALVAESLAREKGPSPQQIVIPSGERLGTNVIEAKNISKGFGDKLLIDNLSFKVPPGAIVGIIGPNGAGKTTLFRMIMDQEKVDSGSFTVGETVKIAYVDQQHSDIDLNKTIWEQITDGQEQINVGGKLMNSRAYVAKFNFNGSDQNKKVGVLSGGERNRLHLALTLRKEANVLLLDEPTNDLDVNTLRALEEGLGSFAGCAVIISHDRWFLDRVCTHILAFEGDSSVYYFEGGYSDYEENRKKRLGDISPTRIKYKKLKR